MEITDVKVFPVEEAKLKAFVSIVIDHCFMINDIKVIQGREGLFISMPSRRKRSGEFKDVAHPLNQGTRSWMEGCILGAYHECVVGGVPTTRPGARLPAEAEHNGNGERPLPRPGVAVPAGDPCLTSTPSRSLEEVEREHLSDSFWSVG